jgi:hypothetical protein
MRDVKFGLNFEPRLGALVVIWQSNL